MILSIIILILHVEKINLTYLDCKIKLNPTYLHLKMKNKYIDLIEQTFEFPNEEFKVIDNELYFNDVPLMDIIKQYGTPLKISYLPKITSQIQKAKRMFNVAMAKVDYQSNYNYCYCTKVRIFHL